MVAKVALLASTDVRRLPASVLAVVEREAEAVTLGNPVLLELGLISALLIRMVFMSLLVISALNLVR